MSYASEVLADSPLAYWKLNDASGNFADSSGNNLPLTPAGTVTCQNVAVIGGAGSVIPLNTWTYIVVTRATTWKSYVNGLIDQASMGTTTAFTPFAATTSIANTVFTGRIGQAAFYTSPLSATRIAAHFAAASTPSTDVLLPMSVTPMFVGG